MGMVEGVGGEIFALRRPRPYSRRLRGGRCVSHCDPNVDIVASMRIPYHAWRITVFITDAALLGRALAPLGTAPTEIAIADSPINRDAFFCPHNRRGTPRRYALREMDFLD